MVDDNCSKLETKVRKYVEIDAAVRWPPCVTLSSISVFVLVAWLMQC